MMKLKEIHQFLIGIEEVLAEKVRFQDKKKTLPQEIKEYTKGQLYEVQYILEIAEKIIYEDNN